MGSGHSEFEGAQPEDEQCDHLRPEGGGVHFQRGVQTSFESPPPFYAWSLVSEARGQPEPEKRYTDFSIH